MLEGGPDMSVIITQVMAADIKTEELQSYIEIIPVKKIDIRTNQSTECVPSQVHSEVIGGSSSSLYSLTESVSIPMSDSYISTDREVETSENIEWDAADTEYMDLKSEEGSHGFMDLMGNTGKEVINLPLISLGSILAIFS
jgi:hypothetical protein